MPPTRRSQLETLLTDLLSVRDGLREYAKISPTSKARQKLEEAAAAFRAALDESFYSHAFPDAVFDPADTGMFGQFAALALVAQPREPLDDVSSTFGGGVYALYYNGKFDNYTPISGTETPIYVGKAQPKRGAKTIQDQGPAITKRLSEHLKSIFKVQAMKEPTLHTRDFEYRRLVIAPGWETAAESALMTLFQPLWNYGYGPVYGLGKHGDKAETRGNKRSPWDTLHPGREWAGVSVLTDQKPYALIVSEITEHFKRCPPIKTKDEVLTNYLGAVGRSELAD